MVRQNNLIKFLKEHGPGLPVGVLRFVVFVPFGLYQGYASNHWKVIKKHDELQGGLFNPSIGRTEHWAYTYGSFAFYWNFAVWWPSILIPPPFSMIFGLVDCAIAILLSFATGWQTAYTPHDIDMCRGSGAHDWQLPPGTNESFFEAAARLNATQTTGFKMCKTFVKEWQYGIVLSFFYSVIALFSIVLGIYVIVTTVKENRVHNRSNKHWAAESAMAIPRVVCGVFFGLAYIPVIVFRCLPLAVKSRTRFTRRYADKIRQRVDQTLPSAGAVKMKVLRRNEKMVYQNQDLAEQTPLADFLGIYDILMLVVPHLHYTDVLNLSLASRALREAVLPAAAHTQRLSHLRLYTCSDTTKAQCWVCTNQVCEDCLHLRSLPQLRIYHHLDKCVPYCKKCYWKLQRHATARLESVSCHCAPPTSEPNVLQKYWKGVAFYQNYRYKTSTRAVCSSCNVLFNDEVLNMREARTKAELKDPTRLQECGASLCSEPLGSGPRWWVCKGCKKECTNGCHAAWGKKEEDGTVIGNEAV